MKMRDALREREKTELNDHLGKAWPRTGINSSDKTLPSTVDDLIDWVEHHGKDNVKAVASTEDV